MHNLASNDSGYYYAVIGNYERGFIVCEDGTGAFGDLEAETDED